MTRVAVTPTPENNPGASWDSGPQASEEDEGCGLLVALDLLAPGVGTVASLACAYEGGTERSDAKVEDPDLFVAFELGSTTYSSPVVLNNPSHDLRYSLFIPDSVVRDHSLRLTVYDQDGGSDRRLISDHELNHGDLRGTLELRGTEHDEPSLTLLGLKFTNPPKPQAATQTIPARSRLTPLENLEIPAGMLVEIRASGTYTIGSWNDAKLGPGGYPNGGPRDYNLAGEVFRRANHGAAVALLQRDSAAQAIMVGACTRFIARSGGKLHVGVNDRDFGNNSGTLTFEVLVTTPSAAAWASGVAGPCQG